MFLIIFIWDHKECPEKIPQYNVYVKAILIRSFDSPN